jgi:hypothetical protein
MKGNFEMVSRAKVQQARLEVLESEFRVLLISCLEECARGRWGLFGQNEVEGALGQRLRWREAERLKEIALEIQSIRSEFGEPHPLCERFLYYCSLRGPNVMGEPRLARAFQKEIGAI